MRILTFTLALSCIAFGAQAADDFGQPFTDTSPAALSEAPYEADVKPWDVEPAAGAEYIDNESAENEQALDLPVSETGLAPMEQPQALEKEIADDLSP